MTYTVVFSPRARDQIIALNAYITETASPRIADRYTNAIASFCFSPRSQSAVRVAMTSGPVFA